MTVFTLTKSFPAEERYSMVDQIRRSSRSVCANLGEAWRKRRYRQAFIAKLNDSEAEAAETQVWLELAERSGCLAPERREALHSDYEGIIAQLVTMIDGADRWLIRSSPRTPP
jgi:four helix bundle protein